jgi:hypothetical protein
MERNRVLEEELDQLRGVAWLVVAEVLGPRPGSTALVADLSEIPGEVVGLITDGVFHDASGVLTSVALHDPTLDFGAVRRGYTTWWSTTTIAEKSTAEWVKEARCMEREATWCGGDVQSTEARLSAAPAEPTLDQGNPVVDPATWLLSSTRSANVDETPQ